MDAYDGNNNRTYRRYCALLARYIAIKVASPKGCVEKHWMDALLEFDIRIIDYTSPCRNDVYQNFKCHDIASYLL